MDAKRTYFGQPALRKVIVSAYRIAGFAILTIILYGLFSYLAVNLFYFVSTSWLVPTVVSPTDERVLQLDALASQESAAKGGLMAKRLELEAQLKSAERAIEMEQAFQDAFRVAMATDLADRKKELARLGSLLASYAGSKRSIVESSRAYAGMSHENLVSQFKAHVIDKDQMLAGNYEIAQIAGANLSLDQKDVEIDSRVAALRREVASLQNVVDTPGSGTAKGAELSYVVLRIEREFNESVLASGKAQNDAEALDRGIATLDEIIAQHDRLLSRIHESPYVLAAEKSLTIAFVPYENRGNVRASASVYGCKLGLLWCSRVGEVTDLIAGEVLGKHPLHNKDVRGVTVRLRLDDAKWIEQTVLYAGKRPLLF